MAKITGLQRLDDTIQPLSGSGDNWHMSWARNDKQYVGLCDGRGWSHLPGDKGKNWNARMYAIIGDAPNHTFEEVPGYPELETVYPPTAEQPDHWSRYYGFGILALDSYLYHFMSTPKVPFGPPDNAFAGVKLIYSPD